MLERDFRRGFRRLRKGNVHCNGVNSVGRGQFFSGRRKPRGITVPQTATGAGIEKAFCNRVADPARPARDDGFPSVEVNFIHRGGDGLVGAAGLVETMNRREGPLRVFLCDII